MTTPLIAFATNRISSDLNTSPSVQDACLRVLSWVTSLPANAASHLTLPFLAKNTDLSNPEILTSVLAYLTGARVPLLNIRYEFIDGDIIEQIDIEEVKEAAASGAFVHPITGELVPDYESKLFAYFELNPDADNFRGNA
jgi:hypothetical protein